MAPKPRELFRKVIDGISFAKKKKTSSIQSEPSPASVGAQAEALSNIGDFSTQQDNDDPGPDNKSVLPTGTYIITNVGRKMCAALCSSDRREGVVASLDGMNLVREAGDEWVVTHHGGDSMYRIQNKRYLTFAGSAESPQQNEPVQCSDSHFYQSYLWRIREQSNGEYMIENVMTNVCWYLADGDLRSPVELAVCSEDPSNCWNFERVGCEDLIPPVDASAVQEIGPVNKNTNRPQNADIDKVYEWLRSVLPPAGYSAALEKRLQHTGLWFINSERYREWKTTHGSFCWAHGSPGTGKTVLSAGIIEDILSDCDSVESIACAYFFFDGRGEQKDLQQLEALVRSLIKQFALHRWANLEPLMRLYKNCHDGKSEPLIGPLWDVLLAILDSFPNAYIIIDALDECSERGKVLDRIKALTDLKKKTLHLLVTSRDDEDVAARLRILDPSHFLLQSTLVNHDIEQYIDSSLQHNDQFDRWDRQVVATIKRTLMEKAGGMFRWVSLQIDELQECHSVAAIEEQLENLPANLYGIYDQIVARINKKNLADVHKILQWLAFSFEPLGLNQVAQVVGVIPDHEDGLRFDASRVYPPTSVLRVCSGLVALIDGTVMLSHMSVKDYLLTRTRQHESHVLAINEKSAHSLIAQMCLGYLLQFTATTNMEDFPLVYYAAQYWMTHVHSGPPQAPDLLLKLMKTLFQLPYSAPFIAWVGIWDADEPMRDIPFKSPLYYASLTGMDCVLPFILEQGADVNAQGGYYCNALQAASYKGYEAVVKILLENGADVNAYGGMYSHALHAASHEGHEAVVKMLLEKGADVNIQGWYCGSALLGASHGGYEAVVKILLEKGVDVNAQGGVYGNALLAASCDGHMAIVNILLEKGADVNAQGGEYGNALQAALSAGHEAVVNILLKKGADINAQGGAYGNALQAASAKGNEAIVKILLEKGVDVNAPGGYFGNALCAASDRNNEAIVSIILEKGADVNAQGKFLGNALQVASYKGHEAMVKILLEKGADINAQGGEYGNALQAASYRGHVAVVNILLEMGADINAQGGWYGNALQAASSVGHEAVVKILLENGANANI